MKAASTRVRRPEPVILWSGPSGVGAGGPRGRPLARIAPSVLRSGRRFIEDYDLQGTGLRPRGTPRRYQITRSHPDGDVSVRRGPFCSIALWLRLLLLLGLAVCCFGQQRINFCPKLSP